MRLIICDKETDVAQIRQKDYKELLPERVNLLILGKSGTGKSQIVKDYAKEHGLKLKIINLASKLPEAIGGIPYAVDKGEYYRELLSEELKEVFDDDGEGWVIFFDEINQGTPEIFNTLYSICYPIGEDRVWAGHSLSKAQIVACGNLNDGSDGTVYLNDLPTPLLNRFFIYELVSNKQDVKDYLKDKWKNKIPQVAKYIDALQSNDIPPRDIDLCLDIMAYEKNGLLLQAKIGSALTAKLYDIQKKVKTIDPAMTLKLCREAYRIFKEDGTATWAGELIEDEKDLLEKFADLLSEEEIKSIVKGG
jgi:hypothetical protein